MLVPGISRVLPLTRAPALTRILGQSGRSYLVEHVLQDNPFRYGRVYLAKCQDQNFILKSVSTEDFKYLKGMYDEMRSSPYVRIFEDANPDESVFIYKYFRDHLLSFVHKDVPLPLTKQILRDSLRGIAALHKKGFVHTDIKADNIMIEWKDQQGSLKVEQVRIADAEKSAYISDNSTITRNIFGHWMWRSPEAQLIRRVNKPTDIFSFGLVCIYALTKNFVFNVDEEKLPYGINPAKVTLCQQFTYFADEEGIEGLRKYIGDKCVARYVEMVSLNDKKQGTLKPFSAWPNIDPDFKDLVGKMTNFDPTRRITAKEALGHKWFSDVP